MIPRWPIGRPSVAKRARQRFRNHPFNLSERMDPLFLGVLLLGALVLGGIWFFAVRLSMRIDRAPEAEVRLIKDERLLVNVRNSLPQKAMLDAVYQEDEDKIYLSQDGGNIHQYKPDLGLWELEKPYGPASPVDPNFKLLQSDCGGLVPCPDGSNLWALGEDGGLVRKKHGTWELVVSDTEFIGADGELVERENLTSAAVSDDGIWLVIGTKSQGFGLYSLDRHRWIRFDSSFFELLQSLVIDRVVWWQGSFWFGGPAGVAALDMEGVRLRVLADIEGAVLDIDADPQGKLWILEDGSCQTPGLNCQRLWTLSQPKAAPKIRLEENERYSELNLARQHFVMESGSKLLMAGETGVYGYDTVLRRWERYHDHGVGPTYAMPESGAFFFGFSGGVGWRNAERTELWPLEGERFVRLTAGREGSVLGLTMNGSIYEFKPGDDHRLIFSGKGTTLDPVRFNEAIALGDQILLTSSQGALLHDIRQRTYQDFKKMPSIDWLLQGERTFVSSQNELYILNQQANNVEVKMLPISSVLEGRFDQATFQTELTAPLAGVRPWQDQGVGLLDGDGRVVQLLKNQTQFLTGAADPNLDRETLVDVVDTGRDLLFATSAGWRIYDKQTRSWSERQPSPSGSPIVEVTQVNGDVYMRDRENRLVRQTEHQAILIGDGDRSAIPEGQLSDVWGDAQGFYMAGTGHLEYYDLGLRSWTGRWRVPTGQTRILGEAANQPMALTNGTATWGDQILGPLNEKALNMFSDDRRIWTVREKETHRYLRGHGLKGEKPACYFRRPTMGSEVTEVTDVRTIGDDVIVAATNAGLRFYDPRARSWFQGPAEVLPRGGWIFDLGEHVLFLERHQGIDRHWVVSRRTIRIPDSCSDEPVALEAEAVLGRGTAVDQERRLFSWIRTDGSVAQWHLGRVREILPSEPDAPRLSQAESWVFQKDDQSILVVVDNALWRYTMSQRAWQRVEHRGADSKLTNWNLASSGNVTVLSALDSQGTLLLGELPAEARAFEWVPVYRADDQRLGRPGSAIIDIQMHPDGSWAFLLQDSVRIFDPFQRRWVGNWSFPNGAKSRSLRLSFGRWIAVEDSIWWVAKENEGNPSDFARLNIPEDAVVALDESGQVWQLLADGRLQFAAIPRGGSFANFRDFGDKPFRLNSDQIAYALTWQGLLIFDLDGQLVAYDDSVMQGKILPVAARDIRLVREPMIIDGDLWLLGDDRLVVLQLGASGNLIGFRFNGMRDMTVDRNGLVWGRDRRGWRLWRNGNFQRPTVREGLGSQDRVFCVEGQLPLSMAPNGSLSTWQQGQFASEDLVFPLETLPSPWGIHRGDDRAWWAWGAFGVAKLTVASCPSGRCLQLDKLWQPDNDSWPKNRDEIAAISYASANGLLVFAKDHLFLPSINSDKLTMTAAQPPKPDFAAENDWDDLQANTLKLKDGGYIYNPITALTDREVSLVAQRPDGELLLAERGDVTLKPGPPLQLAWLSWDGGKRGFQVKTPAGMTFFAADEFVNNGHLLFEPVAAVIAENDQSLVAANAHGFWRYGTRHLGLNQSDITFTPQSLTLPIQAKGRVFQTAAGTLTPEGNKTQASQSETVQVGDIRLSPSPDGEGMLVTIAGRQHNQDSQIKGFPWDRNRHHLVWQDGRLQLVSDAGMHDLESLEGFQSLPQANTEASFYPDAREGVLFGEGAQWFAFENGSWNRQSQPPGSQASQVDRSLWRWQASEAFPSVQLKNDQVTLVWENSPQGPGFLADQLLDAMAENKIFLVSSKAWLLNGVQASDLARFRGIRRDKLAPSTLSISRNKEESWIRATGEDGTTQKWMRERRQFEPLSEPSESSTVWADDRLRFQRTADGFQKSIRLDSGWIAFNMINGRFPFDIVTGIASQADKLFIGSAAGLQVYKQPAGFQLTRTDQWFALAESGAAPARVMGFDRTRTEQPMRVFTEGLTFEKNTDGFTRLAERADIGTRMRYQSDFWQWEQTAQGVLRGRYQAAQGESFPVEIRNGRFQHDRLRDVAYADGHWVALWRSGPISVGFGMGLSSRWKHFQLNGNLRELVVLERQITDGNQHLPRGIYALGSGVAYRLEEGRFSPLENSGLRNLLANYAAEPPIYEREHLRLRQQSSGRLRFEYRDEDTGWKRLPWSDGGRLAIDRIYNFHSHGDLIWAATDAGLVSFTRDGNGQLILRPHHFQLIDQLDENQRARNITDIQIENDQFWVRCDDNSKAVYWAMLEDLKNSQFREVEEDPFAAGIYIDDEASFWEWRWEGRVNGSPGVLQPSMHGEPVTLSSGRFHFDGVTSLAFLRPGILDYTTEDGGWFQTHRNDFNLEAVARPRVEAVDAAEIQSVNVGKRDDVLGFCLERNDESYWWWIPEKEAEAVVSCQACVADDGYWQYEQGRESLRVVSDGLDGPLNERIMVRGRFQDDRVIGMPIAIADPGGSYLLLPTMAGVLKLGQDLRLKQLIPGPFAGIRDGLSPSVLIQSAAQGPLYVSEDGIRQLGDNQKLLAALPGDLPQDASLDRANWENEDILRLGWRTPKATGWHLLAKDDLVARQSNHLFINVAQHDYFISRRLGWGDPDPWLVANYADQRLRLSRPGQEKDYVIDLSSVPNLIRLEPWQDRLYVFGERELLEVRLDRALEALFGQTPQRVEGSGESKTTGGGIP